MKMMNAPRRREQRQAEAQQRQAAWDALPPKDRLARVEARVGKAKLKDTREYAKLTA